MTRDAEASLMQERLLERVFFYAACNKHRPVWKRRLYMILYGASFQKIVRTP